MREDRSNTAGDHNSTARSRVMSHEVSGQLGAIDYSLIVDVHDIQLGGRRNIINAPVLPVVYIDGRSIDNASIGA